MIYYTDAVTDGPKSSWNWAMLCHAAGLTTYIGIPFGNVIVPLMSWLARRKTDPCVMTEGRSALNFNISFTLYGVMAGLLCNVLVGFVLLPVILVVHVVLIVRALLQANKGIPVRYPFTLRFIN
jgi:uncharacterized Tic20 family protein